MSKKNSIIIITVISAITIIAAAICFIYARNSLFTPNFTTNEQQKPLIYIYKGDKIDDIIGQLTSKSAIINPASLRLASRIMRLADTPLKTGCYRYDATMTNYDLLGKIRRGEQTPQKVVINNLRLPEQFAQKVSRQLMLDSTTIYNYITDSTLMQALGFTPSTLFVMVVADTYEMWWTTSIDQLMLRLKNEHDKFWQRNDRDRKAVQLGLSRTEVVTLASIVDEETNRPDERRRIAGLYLNRLHCGMMLQSDPTVKYAVGDFTLNQILYSHLNIDSPYNTYRYYGLPPGPIRLPQTATIDDVLNAEQHNYLYMCAHEDLNGTHRFAQNLSQHNANALRYHQALRLWKRKNMK